MAFPRISQMSLFDAPPPAPPAASYRSVELFAGAGGLGLGLAAAGFQHEVVVERDGAACATLRHNQARGFGLVRDWGIVEADVRSVDLGGVKPGVDLLSGGPPCQPFSIGGKHAGEVDHRDMWPWTIAAVRTLQPRAFLFENVRNLASAHADYLDYIRLQLTFPEIVREAGEPVASHRDRLRTYADCGAADGLCYRVHTALVNAADYGVAQNRQRLFVVGVRRDQRGQWVAPKTTHSRAALDASKWLTGAYWERHGIDAPPAANDDELRRVRGHNRLPSDTLCLAPHRTLRDAITDLGDPSMTQENVALGHVPPDRGARAYPGHTGSPLDAPAKALRAGDHGVSGGENMIDFGNGSYRHYSTREAARLQDFADGYSFPGSWSDNLKQLGNAVPTRLSQAFGDSMHHVLAAA